MNRPTPALRHCQMLLINGYTCRIWNLAVSIMVAWTTIASAQNQTINGSLDVLAGPITLGTANIDAGVGDPYNPMLIAADGLTLTFQDTGGWENVGGPSVDIIAYFTDPDATPYTGDEYWEWYDQDGYYQQQWGTGIYDYTAVYVEGYSQSSVTISQSMGTTSYYNFGTAEIAFLSAKPDTIFRWQVAQHDGGGSFSPQDIMALSSTGGLSVSTSMTVSSGITSYGLYSYGNIMGYGTQNKLYSQTLNGGNASVMTLGLSDSRYLRKDSTVTVSGSFAGGIGQNLISGGTQFVSGKNNLSDSAALFIVGAGSSTSSRKNALTVSSTGNTTVDGTLTVTGATTISSTLSVTGVVTSNGQPVLTQADAVNFAQQSSLSAVSTALTNLTASVSNDYVLKSADSLAMGTNATAATGGFALGYQSIAGDNAISLGTWAGSNGTSASGASSISMGYASHGAGAEAISMGTWNWAAGNDSVSIGAHTSAYSENSVAIGWNLVAHRWGQVVLGTFNITTDYNNTPQPTDDLFIIGNGTADDARSNAFVIKRNGDTTVAGNLVITGEATLADATVTGTLTVAGSQVLTQTDANSTFATQSAVASQLASLNTQLATTYVDKSADSLAMGTNATAGGGGWALGYNSIAGNNAVSIGTWTGNNGWAASGESSISLGYSAHGYGLRAISMGGYNWAQGVDAISMGFLSQAMSDNSVAIGRHCLADRWGQIVVGAYNQPSAAATNDPQPTDELFIVGNGTSDTERSNALVIKRNGDVSILGNLTAAQPSRVQASFVVEGETDPADATNRTVIAKPGQEILVPEQGDISMGEYREGTLPLPVATP